VTDVTNPSYPSFRISRSRIFTGQGVGFSIFDIDEVNERNDTLKEMWVLLPAENAVINHVVYGAAPTGYKELSPAVPLELGKLYRVHGEFFLRLIEIDGSITSEVYSHSEFYEKFASPTDAKPAERAAERMLRNK
jgi:hypothetical protein